MGLGISTQPCSIRQHCSIRIYLFYFILLYTRRAISTQTNAKKTLSEKKHTILATMPTYMSYLFSLISSILSFESRPKLPGKYSRNVSFKYSSVRLMRVIKPSGNRQRGLTLASTKVRRLQHLMLSGKSVMPFLLMSKLSRFIRLPIAGESFSSSLSVR